MLQSSKSQHWISRRHNSSNNNSHSLNNNPACCPIAFVRLHRVNEEPLKYSGTSLSYLCLYCVGQWLRMTSGWRFFRCLVFRPLTRFRHSLKLEGFRDARIKAITEASGKPNCSSIASKGVLSSQAISMTLSLWSNGICKTTSPLAWIQND